MRRRWVISGLAAAFLAIGLTGCGSHNGVSKDQTDAKQTETTLQTETKDKEELSFWMRGAQTDAICQSIQADIDAYNNLEEGLAHVTIEYVPLSDFATKFNTAFAGGTAPDIVDTGVDQISIRAHMGHYLALDGYLDSWGHKEELVDSYLNAGKMLDDGKTYGLAYAPTPCVFVWRKDFFKEAGLNPEEPPRNWNEILEYAEKLVVKEGDTVVRGGFSLEPADYRLFTLMARQAGCTLYNPETNMPEIATEEGIRTLQFFSDIKPYSILYNPAPGANTLRSFLTSESAMAYVTTEEISAMLANDPSLKDKIGVSAYVPAENGKDSTWCGYRLFSVNAASQHQDAAWDVISYLMTEESNRNRLENANVPPAYKSLNQEYVTLNEEINKPASEAIAVGEPFPKTDWMSSYGEALKNAQQEVLYGQKTAEEALKDAEDLIRADAGLN